MGFYYFLYYFLYYTHVVCISFIIASLRDMSNGSALLRSIPGPKPQVFSCDIGGFAITIARLVKKLVECIMPGTVFDVDEILDWGGPLLFADSAIARTNNPRPEQKLAHHTENTGHEDQLPSARSQPQPHGLPRSLDSY